MGRQFHRVVIRHLRDPFGDLIRIRPSSAPIAYPVHRKLEESKRKEEEAMLARVKEIKEKVRDRHLMS